MVVLVLFAIEPNFYIILGIVSLLSITMFVPLKFIHPVRTERWRVVSLPITLSWVFFAGWAAWVDFDPQSWAHWGLVISSLYLTFAGIAQQMFPTKAAA